MADEPLVDKTLSHFERSLLEALGNINKNLFDIITVIGLHHPVFVNKESGEQCGNSLPD